MLKVLQWVLQPSLSGIIHDGSRLAVEIRGMVYRQPAVSESEDMLIR
jgi:hypothetical protein